MQVAPRAARGPRGLGEVHGTRASGRGAVARFEIDPLLDDAVDVRRLHGGGAVAGHIPPAEVIGIDQDDVRLLRGAGGGDRDQGEE